MKSQWYVGAVRGRFEAFRSAVTPTEGTHGVKYFAAIGPFDTKRGALWAEKYGYDNPHFQHVRDAERIARG
jgi:hypothetical protein